MSGGAYSALSGMRARLEELERLAFDLLALDSDGCPRLGDLLALGLDEGAGDLKQVLKETDRVLSSLDLRLLESLKPLGEGLVGGV